MAGPHQDNGVPWTTSTPTTTPAPVVQNQVSPGHPGGAYNPNLNQPPQVTTTNQNVNTGITQTTPDPYDEKGDYMDWDYVNPNTGLTAGENLAQNTAIAKQKEIDKAIAMQNAMDISEAAGGNLGKLSDQQLLDLQDAGLFTHETEGMLGGVTGYEKEVNLLKQKIQSKMDRMRDQNLTDAQFEVGLTSLPEYQQLEKLYGNIGGAETMLANLMSEGTGYDPTGINTWQDTESDPRKLEAYYALTGGDLSADKLREYLPSIGYEEPLETGGGQQFWDPGYYDPRQETFDKLRFLEAGSPQEQRQEQGFFDTMESAYQPDMDEALKKGIFSGAMGQGVFDPKGLRRLITSFGSGVTKPRYANIARGGIVSLVGE
jgi:hypothetical protein